MNRPCCSPRNFRKNRTDQSHLGVPSPSRWTCLLLVLLPLSVASSLDRYSSRYSSNSNKSYRRRSASHQKSKEQSKNNNYDESCSDPIDEDFSALFDFEDEQEDQVILALARLDETEGMNNNKSKRNKSTSGRKRRDNNNNNNEKMDRYYYHQGPDRIKKDSTVCEEDYDDDLKQVSRQNISHPSRTKGSVYARPVTLTTPKRDPVALTKTIAAAATGNSILQENPIHRSSSQESSAVPPVAIEKTMDTKTTGQMRTAAVTPSVQQGSSNVALNPTLTRDSNRNNKSGNKTSSSTEEASSRFATIQRAYELQSKRVGRQQRTTASTTTPVPPRSPSLETPLSTQQQQQQAPPHAYSPRPQRVVMPTTSTTPWVRRFIASRHKDALLPIPREYLADGFNLVQLAPIVERLAMIQLEAAKAAAAAATPTTRAYSTTTRATVSSKSAHHRNDDAGGETNGSGTMAAKQSSSSSFPLYKAALRLILQTEDGEDDARTPQQQTPPGPHIQYAAEALYLLVHARYVISPRGLDTVRRVLKSSKTMEPVFGRCPRFGCRGMPLLPMGESDDYDFQSSPMTKAKRYCCCCGEVRCLLV